MINRKMNCFLAMLFLFSFWTWGVEFAQESTSLPDQKFDAVETLIPVGEHRLNFKVIERGNLTILMIPFQQPDLIIEAVMKVMHRKG